MGVVAVTLAGGDQGAGTDCKKQHRDAKNGENFKSGHSFSLPRMALAIICSAIPADIQTRVSMTMSPVETATGSERKP